MTVATLVPLSPPSDEQRLAQFGLSTELIHMGMRPGLTRAANRTSLALRSTPGTDIYHDGMEQLNRLLVERGWDLVYIDHQPRLLHPDRIMAFTIASGVDVANPDRRKQPYTRRKGDATRSSLDQSANKTASLFEVPDIVQEKKLVAATEAAPLWLLIHERTERGMNLELSRPAVMTESGRITDWSDRILIKFLDLDGDLTVFDQSDDGDIDVNVEPL